ncbi:MAG: hypothetical protein ACRYFS_23695 [Janthinobacterium lividum]
MADMGENILEISGDGNQLRRFCEIADERLVPLSKRDPYNGEASPSVLSFHRLYPIPDAVIALGYNPTGGGHDWQMKHWGVKWSACDTEREEGKASLRYVFETPWYAPLLWLEKVALDYPLLRFDLSFRDPNSNWVDEYVFEDGRLIEEEDDYYAATREDCTQSV